MSVTLDLGDIQGNVLAGFNTDVQVLIGFARQDAADWQGIGRWLADRATDISTVAEVRAQRSPMKERAEHDQVTWLCLAISERVMAQLAPDVIFTDDAFRRGMVRRAGPLLGDRTASERWRVGGPRNVVDVLLIVASNSRAAAEARANQLIESALERGLAVSYREAGGRIGDREHFGFRDGISQPRVIGSDADGQFEAGHFVFGYPKSPGGTPVNVHTDPRGLTRNGSLLVLRRLQQHVDRFRAFCDREATRLQAQCPGITAAHLGALMVGRWPDGKVVSLADLRDPGSQAEADFTFRDDSEGQSCPLGAHIRKVNPRQGPKDVVDVPRVIRRGIPFGPRFDDDPVPERGLLFMSFQTSIVDTVEFITVNWMNSTERPAAKSGHDLLVGRASPTRELPLNAACGALTLNDGGQEWITPTGGAYLFAPSRSALAKLATMPAVPLRTKALKAWVGLTDSLGIP